LENRKPQSGAIFLVEREIKISQAIMAGFILGEKSGQTQVFDEKGQRIPATFVRTTPNYLVGIKKIEEHGYNALKIGFKQVKNIKKPVRGELAKAGVKAPLRFLREFRLDKVVDQVKFIEEGGKQGVVIGEVKIFIGDMIKPEILFKKGDLIDVSGVSKGKGFQGVVRRHHFKGGPRTHGQSDRERAPGSIGQTTTPGRVYRGKRMAGRMGGEKVTVKNLQVIDVRDDGLLIKGLVPGPQGELVELRKFS